MAYEISNKWYKLTCKTDFCTSNEFEHSDLYPDPRFKQNKPGMLKNVLQKLRFSEVKRILFIYVT